MRNQETEPGWNLKVPDTPEAGRARRTPTKGEAAYYIACYDRNYQNQGEIKYTIVFIWKP